MSEIKHTFTPGPWEAVNGTVNTENGSVFCIADCYTPSVGPNWSGTDYTGEQYQLANARLIAAAPALLEALIAVVSVADRATVEFDKARAAIAKARGAL